MMVTILDFSLWRFCGASVVTVVVYHCSVALLPIVPWTDDRSSLLGGIPFEAPACSWTSPEFAPAFREPPENRYLTGARGYEDRASSCGRSPARSNDARSGVAGKPLKQKPRRGWDARMTPPLKRFHIIHNSADPMSVFPLNSLPLFPVHKYLSVCYQTSGLQ